MAWDGEKESWEKDGLRSVRGILVGSFLGLLIWIMIFCTFAYAQPPANADINSPLSQWYRSLKTPEGGSCCSEADCRPVNARLSDIGWEIEYEDKSWHLVPEDRILHRNNEDGRPIACISPAVKMIYCFIPPDGV